MTALAQSKVSARELRAVAFNGELLAWIEAYAGQGYPLFPVGANKRPLVKWKAAASTDISQLRTWWRRWPLAMIGTPTGKASGVVVIDIDRKNGVDGRAELAAAGLTLPADAVEVRTPSGGSHFYCRAPDKTVKNSAGKIAPGVDIRGDGGFIILPPSRPELDGPDYHFAEWQTSESLGFEIGRLL